MSRKYNLLAASFSLAMLLTTAGRLAAQQPETCADCAELGRTAARLQLESLKANDLAHDPDRESQIRVVQGQQGSATEETRYWRHESDWALEHKRTLQEGTDERDEAETHWADATEQYHAALQHEEDLRNRLAALQSTEKNAAAYAKEVADEAAKAWQAYHDCLKKSRCAPANALSPAPTGFSNCPEAKDWMDRASELYRMAEQNRGFAQKAKSAGDTASANYFDSEAKSLDSRAQGREELAARALLDCDKKAAQKTPAGNPTGANPTGTNPAGATPTGQDASRTPTGAAANAPANTVTGAQPTGSAPQPTGAPILLSRGTEHKMKLTIENMCETPQQFQVVPVGLPAQIFDLSRVMLAMRPQTTMTFPLIMQWQEGTPPALFSGSLDVICLSCNADCRQPSKSLPVTVIVTP